MKTTTLQHTMNNHSLKILSLAGLFMLATSANAQRVASVGALVTTVAEGKTGGPATDASNLPAGWAVVDLGTVRKPGAVSYDATTRAFTVRSIGEVTEQHGTFVFTRVKGDFVATCRVTAASQKSAGAGLMVRTGTNSDARFLKNAFNGFRFGNGPAMTARQTDGVAAWQPGDIQYVQTLPCWVRIIRHRDSVASYYSADGKEWNMMHFGGARFSPGLPEEVLVGMVNAQHDSNELEAATLDSFSLEQPVKLPYVTSWLGNTFASQYYQGHVQMQITGLCLDRSGKEPRLRVTGQNEGLDSSVYDLNGNPLWMYQLQNGGSSTIAADGRFIFEASGGNWNGTTMLERLDAGNTAAAPSSAKNQVPGLSGRLKHITGLAAGGGKVYVAEAYDERVIVLDAVSLAEVASFRSPRPGRIALDGKGGLWVGQRPGTAPTTPQIPASDGKPGVDGTSLESRPDGKPLDREHPGKIHYFTVDGNRIAERTITFDSIVEPGHMAVHPLTGQLYVCDAGPNQCIWIFDAQGRLAGHFGELGGVYKNKVPGRVDATHLYFPRAITFDDAGCLYIAMAPRMGWTGGALLRKYDPTGKKIVWERQGLEFQEAADGDPGTDSVEVFTQTHRYTMDFSKGPGQEAVYSALTFDPFTYPADKRNTSNGGGVNATTVRRIGGKRILFLHDWPRNGWMLYRFKEGSEIAIPCGKVTNGGLWIDKNGDGQSDPSELGPKLAFGQCWTVDSNGDIWSSGGKAIRCWRNQGLNEHGVPIYTQEPTETYEVPAPFTEASHVIYAAVLDRLFVGGFNAEHPRDRTDHGGSVGSMLSAFAGVRASKGLSKRLWPRDLPYEAGTGGLGGEVNNFFCASYAGDAQGGYLFVGGLSERGVKKISIWALDPKTGGMAQRFLPGPEVAGYCRWFDFNNAINAMKRKDGEYILFAEDDGAQKVNMFRWRPEARR